MNSSALKPRLGKRIRSSKVAERRARVQAELVAAGGRLFAERGVSNVSVEELLAEVSISRRTFYGFYANKYELVAGVLNPALAAGARDLEVLAEQPVQVLLPGIVECYLSLWRTYRDALTIIGAVDAVVMPYIETGHVQFGAQLREVLRRAQAAGLLRNADADRSFAVISRTAVPLLKVYADHPQYDRLYRESMLALLQSEEATRE